MLNTYILNIVAESVKTNKSISLDFFSGMFLNLVENKEKFKNAYINYYIFEKFCKNKDIQNRKTSARDFEDFLSIIAEGKITDSDQRHNSNTDQIYVENEMITEWVVNNRRAKADIIFENGYKITVKTLIEGNNEINMGSFEKKALFSLLDVSEFLEERVGSSIGLGLGSKKQLLKLLQRIQANGKWDSFSTRFIKMSKHIFAEDFIIFIKSSIKPRVYLISSELFNNKILELVESPEKLTTIITRWEGNCIRMDRKPILAMVDPINIEFNYLTEHMITQLGSNLTLITSNFVRYIVDSNNKLKYKKEILNLCEETLSIIDNNINHIT